MNLVMSEGAVRGTGRGAGSPNSKKIFFTFIKKEGVDTYRYLHPDYMCRELLTGRWYDRKKYPRNYTEKLEERYTSIFIHAKKSDINLILKNQGKLHEFEREAKLPLTEFIRFDDEGLIVKGSKWWQTACWKISLYSFLLKCLSYVGGVPWKQAYAEVKYFNIVNGFRSLLIDNMKNRKELNDMNTNFYAKYGMFWSSSSGSFYEALSEGRSPQRDLMIAYQKKKAVKTIKIKGVDHALQVL